MEDLLPVIVSGIVSGSSYALIGLSIVIIFRATDVVNMAIGDIGMAGVFVAATAIRAGLPVVAALVVTIVVASLFGVATERVLIRPLGPGRLFAALIVTLGLSLLIQAGVGVVWGFQPRPFPPVVEGTVQIFGIAVTLQKVLATGVALAAMAAIAAFFRWSPLGVAMRASAEDPFAARLIGIDSARVARLAWCLGCGLSGVATFLVAADSSINVALMSAPLFRAFAGVFFGGLESMVGAAVGGLLIGVLDNLAGRYVSASFRDTMVFTIIVAVLFLRPGGLLGAEQRVRV
jgi:branched-chain amino acid transport system permease protein